MDPDQVAPPPPPAHLPPTTQPHIAPRTDGLAIASLVLGLLPIFCGIGPILAIVFAFISSGRIKTSDGALKGNGMAIAGLVLGIIFLTATSWYLGLFFGAVLGLESQ